MLLTVGSWEWSNPLPRAPNLELRTWINQVPRGTPNPFIKGQRDWPNPLPRQLNRELRSWINELPPGIVSLPVPPLRNIERPNPAPKSANLELRSWVNELPPGVIGSPVPPIRNLEWPVPPARVNLALRTWIEGIAPQPTQAPFVQTNWPNPIPTRANPDLRHWEWGFTWQLTMPFAQSDWPNPQVIRYGVRFDAPNLGALFGVSPAPVPLPPPQGGLLPGWLGEEEQLGKGLGPYKRPGQVFGEPDPISPRLSSRAEVAETYRPSVAPVVLTQSLPFVEPPTFHVEQVDEDMAVFALVALDELCSSPADVLRGPIRLHIVRRKV